jgi:hypothetical protein
MIDMESRVTASLHARADQGIKVDGLRERAIARARTIRRRQRMLQAVAGAGLAVVVTAGVALAPRWAAGGSDGPTGPGGTGDAGRPAAPAVDAPPAAALATTLPAVTGVPVAGVHPGVVGTDPGVLHFDVDLAALGAASSDWTAGAGYEAVVLPSPADQSESGKPSVEVYVGPDAARLEAVRTPPGPYGELPNGTRIPMYTEGAAQPTMVGDRPATLQPVDPNTADNVGASPPPGELRRFVDPAGRTRNWVLRWQPVDGLHAIVQVGGDDPAKAFALAAALRLDRAQRCAVPLRLTDVAAGTRVTVCRTVLRRAPAARGGVWVLSSVTIHAPGAEPVNIWTEDAHRPRHAFDTAQFVANHTVRGQPAQWRTEDPIGLWVINFGAAEVFVSGAGEAESLRLVTGLQIAEDMGRPETWPQRPIG